MYWLLSTLLTLALSAAAVFATPANETSIRDAAQTAGDKERFEQIYNLDLNGKIDVSNISGDIKITTWESPQVQLRYVKSADNAEKQKDFWVEIKSSQDAFSAKVKYRQKDDNEDGYYSYNGKMNVEYELVVPRTAVLNKISSVSGDIMIDGANNSIRASTVSGTVRGANLGGAVKMSSVSGRVKADFATVEANSNVKLSSVSGSVEAKFPSYIGAKLRVSTVSGSIDNDFGLKVKKGKYVGASLNGTLGDGSMDVRLSTVSGNVNILRS